MSVCQCEDARGGMRDVTISLLWDELVYDIASGGYVEGDVADAEAEHVKHLMQEVCEEGGNLDRVSRMLHLGYAECVEMLYGYTKEEVSETGYTATDGLQMGRDFVFKLRVPSQFSRTTADLLAELLHDYLVCRVMGDWLGMVNPEACVKWVQRLDKVKAQVKGLLSHRMKRVRRKLRPF